MTLCIHHVMEQFTNLIHSPNTSLLLFHSFTNKCLWYADIPPRTTQASCLRTLVHAVVINHGRCQYTLSTRSLTSPNRKPERRIRQACGRAIFESSCRFSSSSSTRNGRMTSSDAFLGGGGDALSAYQIFFLTIINSHCVGLMYEHISISGFVTGLRQHFLVHCA